MNKPILHIIGCGWLGLPLASDWAADGGRVRGSTTSPEKMSRLQTAGIEAFLIDLTPNCTPKLLEDFLDEANVLVLNIPPQAAQKGEEHHPAQIEFLCTFLKNMPKLRVIYLSSTSVYPQQAGIWKESDLPLEGGGAYPGNSALFEAEQLLFACLEERLTVLRCAGLMGDQRIPGKYFSGKSVENPSQVVNLVHLEDLKNIVRRVIEQEGSTGLYNVVSPKHPDKKTLYSLNCQNFDWPLPLFVEEKKTREQRIISGQKLEYTFNYSYQYQNPLDFRYL